MRKKNAFKFVAVLIACLVPFAYLIMRRPRAAGLSLKSAPIVSTRQNAKTEKTQTTVTMVVMFNDTRPFWVQRVYSPFAYPGAVSWIDESGRSYKFDNVATSQMNSVQENIEEWPVSYDFTLRDDTIPHAATQIVMTSEIKINQYKLPVSIVTHRRVNGKMQIVKYPPITE